MSVQKKSKPRKGRILVDPKDIDLKKPEDLWSDKGTPFPKELLKKFSKFSDSCALVRELKKETHRVVEYLITQGQLEPNMVDEFDKTLPLSHFLMLNLASLEKTLKEKGVRLPPYVQVIEEMPETEAERHSAFSQLHRRREQARKKGTEDREYSNEQSKVELPVCEGESDNERREEEKRWEVGPPDRSRSRGRDADRRARSGSRKQALRRAGDERSPKWRNSTHRESRIERPLRRSTNQGQEWRDESFRQQRPDTRKPPWQRPASEKRRRRSWSRKGVFSSRGGSRRNDSGKDPWRQHRPSSIDNRGRSFSEARYRDERRGAIVRNTRRTRSTDRRRNTTPTTRERKISRERSRSRRRGRYPRTRSITSRSQRGEHRETHAARRSVGWRTSREDSRKRVCWNYSHPESTAPRAHSDHSKGRVTKKQGAEALAASLVELLKGVGNKDQEPALGTSVGSRGSVKTKEEENIRKWSRNPCDPTLREISPKTILKNLFYLKDINNPIAEAYWTMLALRKNCDRNHEAGVIRFFEQLGRQAMSYKGDDFMEFFRRALDYPRKDLFDPRNPRFENIVNSTIAEAIGGGRHLSTEPFYHIPLRKIKQTTAPCQELGKQRG